ncbi:MAG: YicC family protein [Planctomycetes bacterium]|nr:YicC family protein [Planctomycetota bacterium]MCW8136072.1 YicC family protein [Planctomycetota bacterium]
MPYGMTGFGRGTAASDQGAITVELKSVNNRFLKVATRLPDVFAELETEIEGRIRGKLIRGSVYCNVSLERGPRDTSYRLNEAAIRDWLPRLEALAAELKTEAPGLADVLAMDGVVLEERSEVEAGPTLKTALMHALDAALDQLAEMRGKEGSALAADLEPRVKKVAALSQQVAARAPQVVLEYRDKLKARMEKLLADSGTALEPEALAREAAYFADRADITEETTRLEHHCTQFLQGMAGKGEVGRKLDFIAQEMLRETNTIASKANDAQLASIAVEMKSELERIKEQVQNLE